MSMQASKQHTDTRQATRVDTQSVLTMLNKSDSAERDSVTACDARKRQHGVELRDTVTRDTHSVKTNKASVVRGEAPNATDMMVLGEQGRRVLRGCNNSANGDALVRLG